MPLIEKNNVEVYMILKEGAKFYRVQSLTRQQWKDTNTKICVFLVYTAFLVFLALLFDISRMGGAVYETAFRPTGYVNGPCISYDATTQKLLTTPHNTGCTNHADRLMWFSASGIIISILLAALAACGYKMRENAERAVRGAYESVKLENRNR